jgi:hypothetical protein
VPIGGSMSDSKHMDIDALRPTLVSRQQTVDGSGCAAHSDRANESTRCSTVYCLLSTAYCCLPGSHRDGHRRTLTPLPYPSLAEAWPLIRAILRRRLQHGYRIIDQGAAQSTS